MKTEFEFETKGTYVIGTACPSKARIIGKRPDNKVYVAISVTNKRNTVADIYIQGKDLERFAVNILKSLKSKHLK